MCDDCFSYNPRGTFAGVFTSGSIHYQDNSHYPLSQIIKGIQSYVAPEGLLVMEYIQLSDENNDPLRHFVIGKQIALLFPETKWNLTSNKKKRYTENPNPRNPNIHNIVWGRLYAQKLN